MELPRSPGYIRELGTQHRRIQETFGRSVYFLDKQIKDVLESEDIARKFTGDYIKLAESYGVSKIGNKATDTMVAMMSEQGFEIEDIYAGVKNEGLRLVDQSKANALYYRMSKQKKFECKLDAEEVNDGFKKALIALQNKEQKNYYKRHDHLTQILQLGKVNQETIKENSDLIKETLTTIYDDIIPDNRIIDNILEAFQVRRQQKVGNVGRGMT